MNERLGLMELKPGENNSVVIVDDPECSDTATRRHICAQGCNKLGYRKKAHATVVELMFTAVLRSQSRSGWFCEDFD